MSPQPSKNALALAEAICRCDGVLVGFSLRSEFEPATQREVEKLARLIDQHLAGLVRAAKAGDDHWNEEHSKVLRGWQPAAPTDR